MKSALKKKVDVPTSTWAQLQGCSSANISMLICRIEHGNLPENHEAVDKEVEEQMAKVVPLETSVFVRHTHSAIDAMIITRRYRGENTVMYLARSRETTLSDIFESSYDFFKKLKLQVTIPMYLTHGPGQGDPNDMQPTKSRYHFDEKTEMYSLPVETSPKKKSVAWTSNQEFKIGDKQDVKSQQTKVSASKTHETGTSPLVLLKKQQKNVVVSFLDKLSVPKGCLLLSFNLTLYFGAASKSLLRSGPEKEYYVSIFVTSEYMFDGIVSPLVRCEVAKDEFKQSAVKPSACVSIKVKSIIPRNAKMHAVVYRKTLAVGGLRHVFERIAEGSEELRDLQNDVDQWCGPINVFHVDDLDKPLFELFIVTKGDESRGIKRDTATMPVLSGMLTRTTPQYKTQCFSSYLNQLSNFIKTTKVDAKYSHGSQAIGITETCWTAQGIIPVWFFYREMGCKSQNTEANGLVDSMIACAAIKHGMPDTKNQPGVDMFLGQVASVLSGLVSHSDDTEGDNFTKPWESPSFKSAQADCEDLSAMCMWSCRVIRASTSEKSKFLRDALARFAACVCMITATTEGSKDTLHMVPVLYPRAWMDKKQGVDKKDQIKPVLMETMANIDQSGSKEGEHFYKYLDPIFEPRIPLSVMAKERIYGDLCRVYIAGDPGGLDGEYFPIDENKKIGVPFVEFLSSTPSISHLAGIYANKEQLAVAEEMFIETHCLNSIHTTDAKTKALEKYSKTKQAEMKEDELLGGTTLLVSVDDTANATSLLKSRLESARKSSQAKLDKAGMPYTLKVIMDAAQLEVAVNVSGVHVVYYGFEKKSKSNK